MSCSTTRASTAVYGALLIYLRYACHFSLQRQVLLTVGQRRHTPYALLFCVLWLFWRSIARRSFPYHPRTTSMHICVHICPGSAVKIVHVERHTLSRHKKNAGPNLPARRTWACIRGIFKYWAYVLSPVSSVSLILPRFSRSSVTSRPCFSAAERPPSMVARELRSKFVA